MRRAVFDESGFTLIEIVAVIMLIALAMGVVGPYIFRYLTTGKQDAAKAQISGFEMALSAYRMDNGAYPSTAQGLAALRTKPIIPPVPDNWRGPYLSKAVPNDPWGNQYVYLCPGKHNADTFDLYSPGADGAEGGEGEARDICNWESE